MPHPGQDRYRAYVPGGVVPEKYEYRFNKALTSLRGRMGDPTALLQSLWNESLSQRKNERAAWLDFVISMDQEVKRLDENSNQHLLLSPFPTS